MFPAENSVSSEIDEFWSLSQNQSQQPKVPSGLKRIIRNKFPELTKLVPLPQKIKKLLEELAERKYLDSGQSDVNTIPPDSQRFGHGPFQAKPVAAQLDSAEGYDGGSAGEVEGNASIMIELAEIWYNIRLKLQMYAKMFRSQVLCPSLKKILNIVYDYGIRDFVEQLRVIFNQLYEEALQNYVYGVCY